MEPDTHKPAMGGGSNRRDFLGAIGAGVAGVAALGAMGAAPASAEITDADILTFALNLEYLEAEFYLRAAFGDGLAYKDSGPNPGIVTGGRKVEFKSDWVHAYANEIAEEEQKHVQFLRAALTAATGSAVSRPAIDLEESFSLLAQVAGLGVGFDPYADDVSFLLASYLFEDLGVTAYRGAAGLISNKTALDKVAGIMAVEAYHAGIIRTALFIEGKHAETQAISTLRAKLDETYNTEHLDDFGVGTATEPSLVVAANATNGPTILGDNAIGFARTARQVLSIVYGKPGASSGLFFPSGLNGKIR